MLVHAAALVVQGQPRIDGTRECRHSPHVHWLSLAPPSDHEMLDRWCDSVGPPIVVAHTSPPPPVTSLVLATWNVHAGNANVDTFVASLATQPGVRSPYGIVLLLQEAVRAGAEVPERYPDRMRPPGTIRARRADGDVGALAARLGLNLAYVPSMRNGRLFPSDAREDRGNAILSTFPLDDVRAIELPFGRQRHVTVAARIKAPGLPPLRVVTAHLDPSGHRKEEAAALSSYLSGQMNPGEPLVLGGDLNTWFGRREATFKTLSGAIPEESCGQAKTNTWPWRLQGPLGWWRGRLDYLFSTLPAAVMRSCSTLPNAFGSDHRPVVLVIDQFEGESVQAAPHAFGAPK